MREYEKARRELDDDENLSIDGVKELLLTSREAYLADFKGRARKITPLLLSQCLRYIRNLSLIESRMTRSQEVVAEQPPRVDR